MTKHFILLVFILSFASCNQSKYAQGERVYTKLCSNCHMPDGSGLNKLIPSLTNSLSKLSIGDQICIIKKGNNADSLGMAMNVMPSFDKIRPAELTNLINYLNHNWNSDFKEQNLINTKSYFDNCR